MIKYIVGGDLLQSKCHTLVNTVNCQGVMGKGLALQFKQKYPQMAEDYRRLCQDDPLFGPHMWPGYIWASQIEDGQRLVLNVATKGLYRNPSNIRWIEMILDKIVANHAGIRTREMKVPIQSMAITELGCGNGKLEWKDVGPRMAAALSKLPFPVDIYINQGDEQYHVCDCCGKLIPQGSGAVWWNEVDDGVVEPTTRHCKECHEVNEALRKQYSTTSDNIEDHLCKGCGRHIAQSNGYCYVCNAVG